MPFKDPAKRKAYAAEHYKNNIAKYYASRKNYRVRMREAVNEIKANGSCVDCGNKFHHAAMHFDHIANNKIMDVSDMLKHRSWEDVLLEISKCELVCANCHSIRTWKRVQRVTRRGSGI